MDEDLKPDMLRSTKAGTDRSDGAEIYRYIKSRIDRCGMPEDKREMMATTFLAPIQADKDRDEPRKFRGNSGMVREKAKTSPIFPSTRKSSPSSTTMCGKRSSAMNTLTT